MHKIKELLAKEIGHFRLLPNSGQALTFSIVLYVTADIISWIFSMAYIFQQTGRFEGAALFDLGLYITIPVGFLINTLLIRYLTPKQIATLGLTGMGTVFLGLFSIPQLNLLSAFIFGLLYGLPCGLYWSNRLFLFTTEVGNHQRDYVSALVSSFASVINVLIPALFGWFIALSPNLGWEKLTAYRWVMLVAFAFYFMSGLVLSKRSTHLPIIKQLLLKKVSPSWKLFRWLVLLGSIHTGVSLALPEALTMSYLGNEGILGTISSVLSLFSAFLLYVLGKQEKAYKKRTKILTFALIPLLLASATLLVSFSKLTILFFLISNGVFNTFFWYVYFPIMAYQIEKNSDANPAHSYPFYLDHEIFINSGRILSVGLYLALVICLKESAIPIAIAISTLSQLGLLVVSRKMH